MQSKFSEKMFENITQLMSDEINFHFNNKYIPT